jgi:hypothetical protein
MPGIGALLHRFRQPRPDPEDVARVKAWVSAALALGDDDAVTVSEIACNDPACPGLETVILVMRKGERTRAFKARGSLVVQTRPAVEAALSQAQE